MEGGYYGMRSTNLIKLNAYSKKRKITDLKIKTFFRFPDVTVVTKLQATRPVCFLYWTQFLIMFLVKEKDKEV